MLQTGLNNAKFAKGITKFSYFNLDFKNKLFPLFLFKIAIKSINAVAFNLMHA